MQGYETIVPYSKQLPVQEKCLCIERPKIQPDGSILQILGSAELEREGVDIVDIIERGPIGCYYVTGLHQ